MRSMKIRIEEKRVMGEKRKAKSKRDKENIYNDNYIVQGKIMKSKNKSR